MINPTTPKAWANTLARIWGAHFPVDVRQIALEYSLQRFKSDPITKIAEADISAFEGALISRPNKGCWYVLYNPSIDIEGRINFTIAHEFGHYLLHRTEASNFECNQRDMLDYGGKDSVKREEEANVFASYLLMPLNDFRQQIGNERISLDLLGHCADRYNVSLTAAALKWLEYTPKRAALVVARDGFVLWSRSSRPAFRAGIFFRKGTPLPEGSIAAAGRLIGSISDAKSGYEVPPGIWLEEDSVREMAIFSDRYDLTISLLIFPSQKITHGYQEGSVQDLVDDLEKLNRG